MAALQDRPDAVGMTAHDAAIQAAAELFRAAGDPERLRLLTLMSAADGPHAEFTVTDLAAGTEASMPAVSQRLRLLRAAGLVDSRRDGRHMRYRLCDAHVAELLRAAVDHAAEEHAHDHDATDDLHDANERGADPR